MPLPYIHRCNQLSNVVAFNGQCNESHRNSTMNFDKPSKKKG